MNSNTILTLCLSLLVCTLSACGGGGGSSIGGSGAKAVLSIITLSGDDTSDLGTTAELNYYAFRDDLEYGPDLFIAATSSGAAMNFVRLGLGELSQSDIDLNAMAADAANSIVFNISDISVSIRINKGGDAYLYSLTCLSGCTGVQFDTTSRTLTLDDVTLVPTIGDDANSQASAPLTLNGTLVWALSDENPNAAANTASAVSVSTSSVALTDNVILADLVGVWDTSVGNDENYTVISLEGSYVNYDYQGDAFDIGSNCYDINSSTIEDLGNGRFRFNGDDRVGTFSFSGKDLIFQAPDRSYQLQRTSLAVTDFHPLCN